MGQVSTGKLAVLILIFFAASFVVYGHHSSRQERGHEPLNIITKELKGWREVGATPLPGPIVDSLFLDDYINSSFSNGRETISLYIGYYYSAKKVGAAHDPLVCFPGQGWSVTDKGNGRLALGANSAQAVSYSTMVVHRGMHKELVFYWFQSYDQTNPDTFSQKISLLWKKILNKGEDNAFVRITIPMGERSLADSKEVVVDFVKSFYPVFLRYVTKSNDT